jgi:ATP-dependent Lon protease
VKDLEDIPDNVKKGLTIIPVAHVDEVLRHALTQPITPVEWEIVKPLPAKPMVDGGEAVVTH